MGTPSSGGLDHDRCVAHPLSKSGAPSGKKAAVKDRPRVVHGLRELVCNLWAKCTHLCGRALVVPRSLPTRAARTAFAGVGYEAATPCPLRHLPLPPGYTLDAAAAAATATPRPCAALPASMPPPRLLPPPPAGRRRPRQQHVCRVSGVLAAPT